MRPIQMVDTKTQYQKIKKEVDSAVIEVMESSAFINGKAVKDFTANLNTYIGAEHTIPCANGTDAIQIALMALGLKPGDEVKYDGGTVRAEKSDYAKNKSHRSGTSLWACRRYGADNGNCKKA